MSIVMPRSTTGIFAMFTICLYFFNEKRDPTYSKRLYCKDFYLTDILTQLQIAQTDFGEKFVKWENKY